jgi:hypothetical protein
VGELTHWIGAIPLLWLAVRRSRSRTHWLLAAAFGVSFVADTAAHWVSPDLIGNLYPLAQAGLIAYALLPLMAAMNVIGLLTLVSLAAVWLGAWTGRDLVLVSAADLAIVLTAYRTLYGTPLGLALAISFGYGLLLWWVFCLDPGWVTWGLYQGSRLAGSIAFCAAAREA